MKTNKNMLIAALAVGGLLVLGTALHAQDSTNVPPGGPPPGNGPGGRMRGPNLDQISAQLNLTDDQKPKVKAVFDDMQQKMRDVRQDDSLSQDDRLTKMRSIRDDMDTKLKAILTPEQYDKWQKMARMRGPRNGPPGGANNPGANPPGAGNPPNAPPN